MSTLVNDVYSRLNPTTVADVVRPRSLAELQAVVRGAAAARLPLALSGGRHAMGGQQFLSRGLLLDTRALTNVLSFDPDLGLVEAEAGICWPALTDVLAGSTWSIRQKQKGADTFSLGGSVAANVHGHGLAQAPIVADVERLVVVGPDGRARTCSRHERGDLFRVACGGYGLFGVVYAVVLRLAPRRKLERVVDVVPVGELAVRLDEWIAAGCVYGDVELEIDPDSGAFLRRGVVSASRPVSDAAPLTLVPRLAVERRDTLLRLAHTDKRRAFAARAADARSAAGRIAWADVDQADDAPGHHWPGSSEMATEAQVPREALDAFLAQAARALRERGADVVRAVVRLTEREAETMLAWAREPWACVVVELHVEHDAVSVGRAADASRALIDVALDHGGSYHLTYHRWARRDQVEAAHPRIREFVQAKQALDPAGVFQSNWYRHLLRLLEVPEAA